MKLVFFLLISIPATLYAQLKTNKKVVMIVSSYGKDVGKTRPGYEMDEFSQAYLIFNANGLQVDVASPKGGAVEAGQFNINKLYNKMVIQDSVAMKLLKHTKPTALLNADDYDAIYIVGGKGPMFDLVVDPALQDLILEMSAKKAIISAVCHGTIAFANIKKGSQYLVKNKSLTGFCNEEEAMFGKTGSEFPFLLEDRLLLRGAKYEKGEAMLPFMIRDENFITGQNPYSTTLVAEEIVKSLGKEPATRKKYNDEMSIGLVKRATQGEMTWARTTLAQDKDNYDLELIAVYGYYQAMFAKEDIITIKKGVSIMELVTPYYFNENLYLKLAEYYLTLGDKSKAKSTVTDVLQKNPNSQSASAMLKN